MDRDDAHSPALARVARGNLCSGCGGCALAAPGKVAMEMRAPGFLRPVQHAALSDGEEARVARICPGLGQEVDAAGRRDDTLWGPFLEMRAGHATDERLRHVAASGGALSAVLVHLVASGAVEGVVQTSAAPAPPVANTAVLSRTPGEIAAAAGSRYAPSAPLAGLEPHLAAGRPLAFVGKPCDVAALRALAGMDSRVDAAFPVMVSFFCAGVPSESGAREVLTALDVAPEEVTAFRYRGHGWPGRATARLADGTERSMSYHDSWGGILSRHVQHRCKICADGTGKAADLVCADAWEVDDRGDPLFEERPGISLLVARTRAGARMMADAESVGRITTRPFDPDGLAAIQPGQRERRRALLARLMALRLTGRPAPRYRGLHLAAAARQNPPRRNLKNFLGMLQRVLRGHVT